MSTTQTPSTTFRTRISGNSRPSPLMAVFATILLFWATHVTTAWGQKVLRALPADAPSLNDTARYLAGLTPLQPGLASQMAATQTWQEHSQILGSDWNRFASRSWKSIRSWSSSELSGIGSPSSPVFYPFSGPDFMYVYNYFPHASAYLLCGLEGVGDVPDISKLDANSLASLRNSLHDLLTAGYFVTKTMRLEMRGTLPLMLVMLARSGCTITSLQRLKSGVEISFVPGGSGSERRLIYLATDLSNGSFGKGELATRLRQLNPQNAYIKSASYLLHQNGFSAVRNCVLSQCRLILQDDSGIPVRYFSSDKWNLRIYGTYTPPLNLFKQYYQADLANLYSQTPTKPLGFGVGYKWNPREADLMVATAK